METRRCAAAGCGRRVGSGRVVCADHRRTRDGRELAGVVHRAAREALAAVAESGSRGVEESGGRDGEGGVERRERARRDRAAEGFRRRVAMGRYGGLFEEATGRILAEAGEGAGLRDELGAVRFAMARLLAEEGDASKMALGVARLAGAAARVAKVQHAIGGGMEGELAALMARVLEDVGQDPGAEEGWWEK